MTWGASSQGKTSNTRPEFRWLLLTKWWRPQGKTFEPTLIAQVHRGTHWQKTPWWAFQRSLQLFHCFRIWINSPVFWYLISTHIHIGCWSFFHGAEELGASFSFEWFWVRMVDEVFEAEGPFPRSDKTLRTTSMRHSYFPRGRTSFKLAAPHPTADISIINYHKSI